MQILEWSVFIFFRGTERKKFSFLILSCLDQGRGVQQQNHRNWNLRYVYHPEKIADKGFTEVVAWHFGSDGTVSTLNMRLILGSPFKISIFHLSLVQVYPLEKCFYTRFIQEVTKRCRLSLLTNSALVIRVQMRGRGGVAGSQPTITALHIT